MSKSENIGEIAKALSNFQGSLEAAKKDAENPFFKSNYATLSSVVESAKNLLKSNGLSVVQTTELMGEKVCLVTTLMHVSGQWIAGTLPIIAVKSDPQAQGSAITYARRYAYAAILGIVTDDDDDGESAMPKERSAAQSPAPRLGRATIGASKPAPPPIAQATDGKLDEYVVKFGRKHAGKTLLEIGEFEVRSYRDFLVDSAAKDMKPLGGLVKEFVDAASFWLTD